MNDPTATLRALADACDECETLGSGTSDNTACFVAQRHAIGMAMPFQSWTATAAALRAMADEVERLRVLLRDIAEAFNGGETPIDDLPAVVRQYMEVEARRAVKPIPQGPPLAPPLHGIAVILNEHMEPGAMLLVCGSAAWARIRAGVSDVG